ncbi:MAG: 50S ribosomal protein L9 [Armatimonadetes bacterium]|nr:50S ribosomal protein L9 [Armatimonadota bacterium]
MRVILNQTVPKLGKQGQVVKVQPGYARNFLFPRGLAIVADKRQLGVLEQKMARVAAADASTLEGAKALKEKLDGQTVRIEGKAGSGTTKLFGAVTSQNIVDAVKDQLGIAIDKKQVALLDPLKRLGKHSVELDLHREVEAHITVTVFDPAIPEEDEAAPEAEAEDVAETDEEAPAEAEAE